MPSRSVSAFRHRHADDPVVAFRGARRRGSTWRSSFAVLRPSRQTTKRCEALLDDHDAWLMPVMARTPLRFGRNKGEPAGDRSGLPHPYLFGRHVLQFPRPNLTGQPALVAALRFPRRTDCRSAAAHRQAVGEANSSPWPRSSKNSCRRVRCRRTTPDYSIFTLAASRIAFHRAYSTFWKAAKAAGAISRASAGPGRDPPGACGCRGPAVSPPPRH